MSRLLMRRASETNSISMTSSMASTTALFRFDLTVNYPADLKSKFGLNSVPNQVHRLDKVISSIVPCTD
jgi:hypothetical protein